MNLTDLSHLARWQQNQGEFGDVAVSSRVRLARNLAGMSFLSRCSDRQVREIADLLRRVLTSGILGEGASYIDITEVDPLDRQLLVERHLISRQHAEGDGPRGVAVTSDETLAVMVNEEDHLRMQVLAGEVKLKAAYEDICRFDGLLEEHLTFAFSSRFGYLTACPTNVGTALRVSVMLHLPALKMTGEIEKTLRSARDMHLAVRGLYGEGTEAIGDLFQVSNQTTLGKSEEQIVEEFRNQIVPGIIEYERSARAALLENRRTALEDRVFRASAVMKSARLISSEETMFLISQLRLGVNLDIIKDVTVETLNELSLLTAPAHLQRFCGRQMSPMERGQARAKLIREKLGGS
ncbi:MAG: protein arginine kinase [Planctomycetota bacterium]|nr:protein arginine kinase [Planctomycetota bacterium]